MDIARNLPSDNRSAHRDEVWIQWNPLCPDIRIISKIKR